MFCCLKLCLNGNLRTPLTANGTEEPSIFLDGAHMGHEVVIVKNCRRLCGSGGALCNTPLVQSKSYFEVKIQQSGQWSIGLATREADLNKTKGGTDKDSWCLCSDSIVRNNDQEIFTIKSFPLETHTQQPKLTQISENIINLTESDSLATAITNDAGNLVNNSNLALNEFPTEGDTIGVAYDHVELNFYLNGKNLEVPVLNVKGTVYPVLYVDDGAILDIILDNFTFGPPSGFERIMIEQSLL